MHTEIDYDKVDNPEKKAIADLKEWYGTRKFNMLSRELKNLDSFEYFENLVSISGVSGYPVRVWWKTLKGEQA